MITMHQNTHFFFVKEKEKKKKFGYFLFSFPSCLRVLPNFFSSVYNRLDCFPPSLIYLILHLSIVIGLEEMFFAGPC